MATNLIVCFSLVKDSHYPDLDKLEIVAGNILMLLEEATLFKVEPLSSYYHDSAAGSKNALMEKKTNARPKILDYVHHFQKYQNIFLIYPNWHGTMPMAMMTFLECHQTSGKKIIPVCLYERGGYGTSIQDIRRACPNAAVILGLAIQNRKAGSYRDQIKEWLDEMDLA